MMRRAWVCGLFGAMWVSCAAPSTAVKPEVRATVAPTPAATGDEPVPVAIELSEVRIVIAEDGTVTRTRHEVYRLLSSDPGSAWTHAYAFWSPGRDAEPELSATVVSPDGTTVRLDPKTVSDQADQDDDGLITDNKLRLAPLPNLSVGAVVDRTAVTRGKSLFDLGASVVETLSNRAPEKKRVVEIDVPASAPLHTEILNSALTFVRTERDGRVHLRIDCGATTPPHDEEPGGPRVEVPFVRVSTIASWQSAAEAWWAKVAPQVDVAGVEALAKKLTAGQTTREGKVRELTAWLWANIRYTGLELDEAAWVPRKASEVLERKYGDCKDLSVLLTSMLRAVGLEADPALLSAGFHQDASDDVPALSGFNHAIVRVGGPTPLWVDPTAEWSASGEVPASVAGRKALVARPGTRGLELISATGGSFADSRFDWYFAPSGPARLVRTRTTEGLVYREWRMQAASSVETYRKNLETWAHDSHGTRGVVKLENSDPRVSAAFKETFELPDTSWARTRSDSAEAVLAQDVAFAGLYGVFDARKQLDERKAPFILRARAKAKVTSAFHLPPGYRLETLPAEVREVAGPAKIGVTWRRAGGDDVEGVLTVELEPGELSVADAKRLIDDIYPRVDVELTFLHSVHAALEAGRTFAAVKEAEALLAKSNSAPDRAMLAYALSSAGLQADAEVEARKALAQAPKDLLVRNRVSFVLLRNEHGREFGVGYPRAEALRVTGETLAQGDADEWARRMHALVSLWDERGNFGEDRTQYEALSRELAEYREKTKSRTLDDEAIDVWLKQRAWSTLRKELPNFKQTTQRDGAWLLAEVLELGVDQALTRATQEHRDSEEASSLAIQLLLFDREYQALSDLFDARRRKKGEAQAQASVLQRAIATLKRADDPPANTPAGAWLRFQTALLDHSPLEKVSQFIDGAPDTDELQLLRDAAQRAVNAPRGAAEVNGYLKDFELGLTTMSTRQVKGFGELLDIRFNVSGLGAPQSTLLRKSGAGYRVRIGAEEELAAAAVLASLDGRDAEAVELLRVLVAVVPQAPAPLKSEAPGYEPLGFLWAARYAAQHPPARERVVRWLEGEVRKELPDTRYALVRTALDAAWEKDPAARLKLGQQLLTDANPERHVDGLVLSVRSLVRLGRAREALSLLDAELAKNPRARALSALRVTVLAAVGDFAGAQQTSRQLAADAEPREAAMHLNNAAWWALFTGKVGDDTVKDIERSVELNATASNINTAVCVYAAAGRWDAAARESLRMASLFNPERLGSSGPSYWFARAMVAQGFGRTDTARALFKKVKKDEWTGPDDVWSLAQKQLTALGEKK